MTDLREIADLRTDVPLPAHGVTLRCRGATAEELVGLVERFPALGGRLFPLLASQGAPGGVDAPSLVAEAPGAVHALIALGLDHPGDTEYEAQAARLPFGVQVELLLAIIDLTIPGGIVPFVQKITSVFGTDVRSLLPAEPKPEPPSPLITQPNGVQGTDLHSR